MSDRRRTEPTPAITTPATTPAATAPAATPMPAVAPATPGPAVPRRATEPEPHPGLMVMGVVILCSVLAERAILSLSTGGSGGLQLVAFVAPAAAIAAVIRYGASHSLGFMASPRFVFAVLPYLVLDFVLPFLGVMYNRYPERTLWSATEATTALSFLILGAVWSADRRSTGWQFLLLALVANFAYAAGQAIYLAQLPGWQFFGPFHQWDLSLQSIYGELVQARGTGLFFNPNTLGLWCGVGVVLGWAMLPGRWRTIGVVLAVLTLVLSESRGASVALVAAILVGAVSAIASGRLGKLGGVRSVITYAAAIALAAGAALVIEPQGTVFERFSALIAIVTQGPQADANLAGRIDYWSAVVSLNAVYPFGTWGSPEMILGTAIDSSWFRAFAQGSVPYMTLLGLVVASAFTIGSFRWAPQLRMLAVLVAVAGLTETSFSYPPIFMFWMLLGAGLQSNVRAVAEAQILKPAIALRFAGRRRPAPDAPSAAAERAT